MSDKEYPYFDKMCPLEDFIVSIETHPRHRLSKKLSLSIFIKDASYITDISLSKADIFKLCDFFTECKKDLMENAK